MLFHHQMAHGRSIFSLSIFKCNVNKLYSSIHRTEIHALNHTYKAGNICVPCINIHIYICWVVRIFCVYLMRVIHSWMARQCIRRLISSIHLGTHIQYHTRTVKCTVLQQCVAHQISKITNKTDPLWVSPSNPSILTKVKLSAST